MKRKNAVLEKLLYFAIAGLGYMYATLAGDSPLIDVFNLSMMVAMSEPIIR